MKKNSSKYWDKAWSLVSGCTPVSEACDNCWLALMDRFKAVDCPSCQPHPVLNPLSSQETCWQCKGEGKLYPYTTNRRFNGTVHIYPERLDIPLKRKKPTVYAVWSDLFHHDVPDEFITKAICNMRVCAETVPPINHTFLILTKRPNRMIDYFSKAQWLSMQSYDNIWFGVTAENQEQADKRIPILLQIPAAKRFVSIEPMLGPIDLHYIKKDMSINNHTSYAQIDYLRGTFDSLKIYDPLDLIILGGESGHKARPMWKEWAHSIRDQCQSAGVPFFFKNWGNYKGPKDYTIPPGRLLDGKEYNDLPWRK